MNNWLMAVLLHAACAAALERPPAVAGQFYPDKALELSALVDGYLGAARSKAEGRVLALLVPHAGVEFSGATAAKAYGLLKKGSFDTVIVVGTGHYAAVEGAAVYPGDYAALGFKAEYDAALAQELMKAEPLITASPEAHAREHSIEVQLPFLLKTLGAPKLVALTMNTQDLEVTQRVGAALAKAAKGRKVLLVASSDLSHYPDGKDDDAVDKTTLAALETLDPAFFWLTNRFLLNRGIPHLAVTYCGEGAVAAVMTAAKELGATKAQLLERLNSGDVVSERDYHHVVGYAAVAFVKGPKTVTPGLTDEQKRGLLAAARRAVQEAAEGAKSPPVPLSSDPRLNLPAAAFVTLKGPKRALRGCIGSFQPQESLLESVIHNAAASAVSDHRFKPVAQEEVSGLRIEVSILSAAKTAASYKAIRPHDGVALLQGEHTGVFLPQVWEDLPDKTRFLQELCSQKAGLPTDCYKDPATSLKTFGVELFEEH